MTGLAAANVRRRASTTEPRPASGRRRRRRIVVAIAILTTVGIGEVRVVEDIKQFYATLGPETFAPFEILCQGKVHIPETGVAEEVAAHCAERSECRANHHGIATSIAAESRKCAACLAAGGTSIERKACALQVPLLVGFKGSPYQRHRGFLSSWT